MNKIFLFLGLFLFQSVIGQSTNKINNDGISYINSILNKNILKIEILAFEYPEDIKTILIKFQNALVSKKEWAEEYFSKFYKSGEGLPYHENFGISKDEYQQIKKMDKSSQTLTVKDSSSIKVERTSNLITFKSSAENTEFIEYLTIDIKNKLLIFISDTIPISNEIKSTSLSAYGMIEGYKWEKSVSNLSDKDDFKRENLISKIQEINFGKDIKTGKILLTIKYKEINKGEVKANLDVACRLY